MPESWATAAGIALDHTADVPLGVQLDWVVRAAVASGRLRAGDRLPGLREVAEQLGVNHNTVRAAVAKLEADGLLETRHGSGTFVAAGAGTQLRQAALLDEVAQRAQDAGVAPRELAAALYVAEPAAHHAPDQAAAERRTLRQDLAVLDRILCELEPQLDSPLRRDPLPAARGRGPRLLGADELSAQRDTLLRRLVEVQRALDAQRGVGAPAPEPAPAPARVAAPRRAAGGRRVTPRPGTAPA
ncbi:GntR family transcriptional regulator [Baekduia sp.]|jgi:DNA-binding FadR family transcriptional regulator|uniref:GntR family transcriptional regulator n=1 Tax=Baekduia sp. TaxID=2600305 RepID=UPI002E006890|nr:GntR family transcriptional regulator [Baekduia sp.]